MGLAHTGLRGISTALWRGELGGGGGDRRSGSPGLGRGRTQTRATLGRLLAEAHLCVWPKGPASQQARAPCPNRTGSGGPEAQPATEFVGSSAK